MPQSARSTPAPSTDTRSTDTRSTAGHNASDRQVFAPRTDPAEVLAAGVALRATVPHEAHGRPGVPDSRPDPVAVVEQAGADRLPDLAAVRIGRMVESPFAFLRGAAGVMAGDLARNPVATTGIDAQICGDAHASNFGLYASPERRLVMDLNDFDETVQGPWEWDLKRLATSLVVAGRVAGVGDEASREVARDCARAYRAAVHEMAVLPTMDAWYLSTDESTLERFDTDQLSETFRRVSKKARKNTSRSVAASYTQQLAHDDWQFAEDPPLLVHVPADTERMVERALGPYADTLAEELRHLLSRFTLVDVAFRVVGLGSVGLRSYVVLLHGAGGTAGDAADGGAEAHDTLVLQVKEARTSALAPFVAPSPYGHEGQRILHGQVWMQSVSDILLGWTTLDGRPFLVRQFRDMKGSIDPTELKASRLDDYARVVGAVLGRAHARSADPRLLSGYLGVGADGERFDAAVATLAVAYADRTEADHEALVEAVRQGRLAAATGI